MSSDIVTVLQLDKVSSSNRLIIAKEINGCDSTFIISCVLGHCVRNKAAVLILSTHTLQSHFQNVGLKMNYNLQKHVDSGTVYFYSLGTEIITSLLANIEVTLEMIFLTLKEKIISMREKHGKVNVILDGISHLFDLQCSLKDINKFCSDIIHVCREDIDSFVLIHCNVASEDDVTHVMANLLTHKANTVVEVESLSSGWSADVSGHLSILHPGQKFDTEHMFIMDQKPNKYLFKLFDRGVKLLAPGSI